MKNIKRKLGFLSVSLLLSPLAFSNEIALSCAQGEEVIFTSDIADVNEFDTEYWDVELTQTLDLTEKNQTVYIFNPGLIVCIRNNEEIAEN